MFKNTLNKFEILCGQTGRSSDFFRSNILSGLMPLVILLGTVLPSLAQARSLTFTQIYLTQSSDSNAPSPYMGNDSLETWCAGYGSGVDFGSYAAAKFIEAQGTGLYQCKGEFVNTPQKNRIQIFKIDSCTSVDPNELRKDCKR